MIDFTPTDEQHDALGLFASGQPMAIEAGAGTGKTSTLELLARSTKRVGQYAAFNRAIVDDSAVRMPATVNCSTMHSLAFRGFGRTYAARLGSHRMPAARVAKRLGIQPLSVQVGDRRKIISPATLASIVQRSITRFCFTADEEPGTRHFEYIEGIDPRDDAGRRTYRNNRMVRIALFDAQERLWADIRNPTGELRFTHDHYLKMWQLTRPQLPVDFLLVDEAQDLSPVMLDVLARQRCQVVWVGDSQQQIYEWRGAVNALATVDAGCTTFLSRSFRFGQAIADAANVLLEVLGSELHLEGNPEVRSSLAKIEHPRAVLCRSNGQALERVMALLAEGRKPYLVGGGTELITFAKCAWQLMEEGKTWHPELACFSSWNEVVEFTRQDPQGDELRLLVDLVDKFGAEEIVQALDAMTAEPSADIILSTAHKAKGREWPSVQLAADFQEPEPGELGNGERRLLYVALTRAKFALDHSRVEPLTNMLGRPTGWWVPEEMEEP